MALLYNLLSSVFDYLEQNIFGALSGPEPEGTTEEHLKDALEKGTVCLFTQGTISGVDQVVNIVRSNGIKRIAFLNIRDVLSFDPATLNGKSDEDNASLCLVIDVTGGNTNDLEKFLRSTCRKTYPLAFINGDCVGDFNDIKKLQDKKLLPEYFKKHEFDLIVIGGGSGGLAAAKRAALKNKKVAVLDFVKPTPIGTSWGLGGTCVNVGCIPKKLMHQAAILGKSLDDARKFGWQFGTEVENNWKTLISNVKNHILSLNYAYKIDLRQKNCTYVNGYGSFVNSHTIKAVDKNNKETLMTADRFLIATGIRPRYLDIPGGREYCITSDDLFFLSYPPGKTLLVGASYIALECSGFLKGLGYDVTVMVRSILLRGFDQDMANRIGKHMEDYGVKFIHEAIPTKIEKLEDGKPAKLKVTYIQKTPEGEKEASEEFNTVILAIGRDAVTDDVNLDNIGVTRNKAKKLVCMNNEQSVTVPHVYAIGDVSEGRPELTPVAIQAGKSLIDRLYSHDFELFDYTNIPTAVFTPLEYGACGLSEEEAKSKFGDQAVVYHSKMTPLEYTVAKRKSDIDHCYSKLIFHGDVSKPKELKVVGFHYLGPNAGEVTQGFGMALKFKAKLSDFTQLVGIHPTVAEVFTFPQMVVKTDEPLVASGC